MSRGKIRSDGSGSIYQRSDGRWVAQVRVYDEFTGTSRKVRRYAANRQGARDHLKAMREQPATVAAATARTGTTVADWLEHWRAHHLPVAGLSAATEAIYGDLIEWYAVPTLGQVRLEDFDALAAEQWLARMRAVPKRNGDPLAEATVRKTYNVVRKALEIAVREHMIASNPLLVVARPSQHRPRVPHASASHVAAVVAASADMRVGPLVVVVANTGLRIGEALGLRWSDIDLDTGRATVSRSGAGTARTKTGKVRTITLLPEVVEALRQVQDRQAVERAAMGHGWADRSGLVFTTGTGTPYTVRSARRDLRVALVRAGLPTERPWHTFRHGFATRLIEQGVPLPIVSAILGHSGIAITVDTYGHLDAAIPADILAAALAPPAGNVVRLRPNAS